MSLRAFEAASVLGIRGYLGLGESCGERMELLAREIQSMAYIVTHESRCGLLHLPGGHLQASAQSGFDAEGELIDALLAAVESVTKAVERGGRGEAGEALASLDEGVSRRALKAESELVYLLLNAVLRAGDELCGS